MQQTIIAVLKIQRNEAMDTIAVLNGHLAELREENARLKREREQPSKENADATV